MAVRIKDEDYLYISTRIKMRRKYMLNGADYARMATAPTFAEARKTLLDKGYVSIEENDSDSLEKALADRLAQTLDLLYRYSPDRSVIDIFNLKYDYHNLKVLLKAPHDAQLLMHSGTLDTKLLEAALAERDYSALPETMAEAVREAVVTADLQKADILLDKAMCEQMLQQAHAAKSEFLEGYVKLFIDAANLKTAVRAARAGKSDSFITESLIPGGSLELPTKDQPFAALQKALCGGALATTAKNAGGLSASLLDKQCDNALLAYANASRAVNYGEAHVIAHLLFTEAEIAAVRLVFTARMAGTDPQKTLERLREV